MNKIPNICGRCYAPIEDNRYFDCEYRPEELRQSPIGMHHCPVCGAMVMAGLPHPTLCEKCYGETCGSD